MRSVKKFLVAVVLLVAIGIISARVYVAKFSIPTADGDNTTETLVTLQRKLNLPKSLVGQEITALAPDFNHLFSKVLGGVDANRVEVGIVKWKLKFFLVAVRSQKILDAIEAPFWGEDQGWFVGCVDKPTAKSNGPPRENSVAFAGWQGNQRQIQFAWRVDPSTGQFSEMPEKEFNTIDCSKVPGWLEDFEDAEEEV